MQRKAWHFVRHGRGLGVLRTSKLEVDFGKISKISFTSIYIIKFYLEHHSPFWADIAVQVSILNGSAEE